MSRTVWSVDRATLDGVLFRTQAVQTRKKSKTDNSCIVGGVKIQRGGRLVTEKCYGVIKAFYFHFMYPPHRSTYKLTSAKLDQFHADSPWILCALCEWHEPLGTNPLTGLLQIQPNQFWADCPLTNMANCYPLNVVFWPAMPFAAEDFDKNGEVLDKNNQMYDFSGTGVLDVVTHHERP
jgi:hypothetical protein